jgi:signal recognition particle receptor subunit beta
MELSIIVLLATLLCGVAGLVSYLLCIRRGSNTSLSLLLVGPCEGGKTCFAHRLAYNEFPTTCTSMRLTETEFVLDHDLKEKLKAEGGKKVNIVDIPGHPRVREEWKEYIESASHVLFVVDATTLKKQVHEVCSFLLDIMTFPLYQKRPIPISVVLNKSDIFTSLPKEGARKLMEAEIEMIRSRTGDLKDLDDNVGASASASASARLRGMSVPGESFTFEGYARLGGGSVSFVSISAKTSIGQKLIETVMSQ